MAAKLHRGFKIQTPIHCLGQAKELWASIVPMKWEVRICQNREPRSSEFPNHMMQVLLLMLVAIGQHGAPWELISNMSPPAGAKNDFHHPYATAGVPQRTSKHLKIQWWIIIAHALPIKNAVKLCKSVGLAPIVSHFRIKNRHLGNPLLPSPRLRRLFLLTGPRSPGGAGVWGRCEVP